MMTNPNQSPLRLDLVKATRSAVILTRAAGQSSTRLVCGHHYQDPPCLLPQTKGILKTLTLL